MENFQLFVDQSNEKARSDLATARMENGVLKISDSTGYHAENTEYEWFVPNEEIPEDVIVPSPEPEPEPVATSVITPNEEEANDNQKEESDIIENEPTVETAEDPKTVQEDKAEVLTKERILKEFRKFNIDLSPKVRSSSLALLIAITQLALYF